MVCRGVHFALTDEEASRVLDECRNNEEVLNAIAEIEEQWNRDWLQQTDKAWDAIHRCLTGGRLEWGSTPLHKVILGEDNLYEGDGWIITYLEPDEVREVADAIKAIDEAWMRTRYFAIDPKDYRCPITEEDFENTWSWFARLRDFFQKAAAANRWVIFSVDQ